MAEVFEVLAKHHADVKQMAAELEAGPTASSGATSDDLSMRKKMVGQLVIEESKHEAVEEMYFWPAVRKKLPDGDAEFDKKTAPTRPHPHMPPSPGALKSAVPPAAAADRVRDKATGRGE